MNNHIPTIYDVAIDEYRQVTQADVEELVKLRFNYSQLRINVFRLKADLDILSKQLDIIMPD